MKYWALIAVGLIMSRATADSSLTSHRSDDLKAGIAAMNVDSPSHIEATDTLTFTLPQ